MSVENLDEAIAALYAKTMILHTIERYLTWLLIAILFLNLSQRKIPNSHKKRFATIYIAALVLLFQVGVVTILTRELNHYWAWLVLALCLFILYLLRERALPFRLHCTSCSKRLVFTEIIGGDENLCASCMPTEEEDPTMVSEVAEPEVAMKVEEIDWESWEPTDVCVITFLFAEDQVLLIDKKTGLGKGLVNAPGGHVEADETAEEAAAREFAEETGISVTDLSLRGMLYFQFADGMRQKGYVFFTTAYSGEMEETAEARPFWTSVAAIPYDKMWEDDQYWLPAALAGKHFTGYFTFSGEVMVDKHIIFTEEEA